MQPNLRAWLLPHAKASGAVEPLANLGNQFLKLANRAKVEWKRNGLRHSFISYRVAQTRDIASVSIEAGNSPQVIPRHYCRQRGWKDLTFYVDKISGAKASRPALDRLMQDIRAGEIERLVVYKLDRLGRSLTHLALILDELNRLRVPLIASSQGIDTSDDNPAGRLQLGVLMAVASSSFFSSAAARPLLPTLMTTFLMSPVKLNGILST